MAELFARFNFRYFAQSRDSTFCQKCPFIPPVAVGHSGQIFDLLVSEKNEFSMVNKKEKAISLNRQQSWCDFCAAAFCAADFCAADFCAAIFRNTHFLTFDFHKPDRST
jgi:hypothetical protein